MRNYFCSLFVIPSLALVAQAAGQEPIQKTFIAYDFMKMDSNVVVYKGVEGLNTKVIVDKKADVTCSSTAIEGADDGQKVTFNVEGANDVRCHYGSSNPDQHSEVISVTYEMGEYKVSIDEVKNGLNKELQEAAARVSKMDFDKEGELIKFLTDKGITKDATIDVKVPANKFAGLEFTVGDDEYVAMQNPQGNVARNKVHYAKADGSMRIGVSGIAEKDLQKYGLYKGVNKILVYKDKNAFELVCAFTPNGGATVVQGGTGIYGTPGKGKCIVNGSKPNFANYAGEFTVTYVSVKKKEALAIMTEMMGDLEKARKRMEDAKKQEMDRQLAKNLDAVSQINDSLTERFNAIRDAVDAKQAEDERKLQEEREKAAVLKGQVDELSKTEAEKEAIRLAKEAEELKRRRAITDSLFITEFGEKLIRSSYVATFHKFKKSQPTRSGQPVEYVGYRFENDSSLYYSPKYSGLLARWTDATPEFQNEIITNEPWKRDSVEESNEMLICSANLPTLHMTWDSLLRVRATELTPERVQKAVEQLAVKDPQKNFMMCHSVSNERMGSSMAWFKRGKTYKFCWQPQVDTVDEGPRGMNKYVKLVPLSIVASYESEAVKRALEFAVPNKDARAIPNHPFFKREITTPEPWDQSRGQYRARCSDPVEIYSDEVKPGTATTY